MIVLNPEESVRSGSVPSDLPQDGQAKASEHTIIVSAVEINDHHGVGVYLARLFQHDANVIALRSRSLYGGHCIFSPRSYEIGRSTSGDSGEWRSRMTALFRDLEGARIIAVPYYPQDFENALLLKELTGARLCVYLMDDQNIFESEVSDSLVEQLLRKSDLRLAISPEMGAAYQAKFGYEFAFFPPLVRSDEIPEENDLGTSCNDRFALTGNFWRKTTFEKFCALIHQTGAPVDWFGKGPSASWLETDPDRLTQIGIHCAGFLPAPDFVNRLRGYPVMIVPSGSLDSEDGNLAFSRFSLPSRLVFGLAQARIPILVLGHPDTAAGRFVSQLGIGEVSPYDVERFQVALANMLDEEYQRNTRKRCLEVSQCFVMEDPGAWILDSLKRGKPLPCAFDGMLENPDPIALVGRKRLKKRIGLWDWLRSVAR
jgi:hypothetical protein